MQKGQQKVIWVLLNHTAWKILDISGHVTSAFFWPFERGRKLENVSPLAVVILSFGQTINIALVQCSQRHSFIPKLPFIYPKKDVDIDYIDETVQIVTYTIARLQHYGGF